MKLRRQVSCQEWTELITDYLEGTLSRSLVRAIERHLAQCPHCTEYLAQMRLSIRLTGAIPADDPPESVLDAFQRAFEEHRRNRPDPSAN